LGLLHPLSDISLNCSDFDTIQNSSVTFTVKVLHREIKFEIEKKSKESMRNVKINGDDGHCFIIHDEDKEFASIIPQHSNIAKEDKSLVLSFDEENAERIEISGGKGASLARLHSLSLKNELLGNSKFSVPKGIIVTTNSYNILMEDAKLKYEIDSLQKLSWSLNQNNLKSECTRVSNFVANSELPNKIKHEIDTKLMSVFGNDFEQKLFAVR